MQIGEEKERAATGSHPSNGLLIGRNGFPCSMRFREMWIAWIVDRIPRCLMRNVASLDSLVFLDSSAVDEIFSLCCCLANSKIANLISAEAILVYPLFEVIAFNLLFSCPPLPPPNPRLPVCNYSPLLAQIPLWIVLRDLPRSPKQANKVTPMLLSFSYQRPLRFPRQWMLLRSPCHWPAHHLSWPSRSLSSFSLEVQGCDYGENEVLISGTAFGALMLKIRFVITYSFS